MPTLNGGGWLLILWLASCSFFAQADEKPVQPLGITVISNDFVLPGKISLLREIAQSQGIELTGYTIGQPSGAPQAWFTQSDLVILDTPRGNDRTQVMEFVGGALEGTATPWLAVGGGKPLGENLPPQIMRPLLAYYSAGGEANFRHMMAFVQAWQRGQNTAEIPAPQALPEAGFYHPQAPAHFEQLSDYLEWGRKRGKKRWQEEAPVLAVAMSSGSVSDGQTAAYDYLIGAIEGAGAVPVVFWYDRNAAQPLTPLIAAADPVMLVNTTHMMGEKLRQDLQRLDIPVVMGLNHRDGGIEKWREATQGLPAGTAAALMMIPESWGMSDPLVLTAVEDGAPKIIPEQLELLLGRFRAMARLRNAKRNELNIALLFWNTPSGERNLSASNLNVPRSIENILRGLEDGGYAVEPKQEREIISTAQRLLSAYYHPEKLDALLADGLAVTLPLDIYLSWLQSLPPHIGEELEQAWGEPENHWSIRRIDGEDHFVIPLARAGKLAILPQPPRADRLGESTHDLLQPPGHFYLATYLHLRETFAADALIHLGTHGTQEWTPGKDRGLWAHDYPNLAAGNVPIFYPYIQDNIGEAMQAKRRGRATVISHQTPPFAPSGFYGELRDIHDLMHRYLQLESGVVRDTTLASMLAKVEEHNLHRDLNWTPEEIRQRSGEFIPLLHDHLHALAKSSTPVGLHSFGESAAIEHRIATVMQQLGSGYYQALDLDLTEIFAASYDGLFSEPAYQYLEPYLRGEKAPSEAGTDALQTLMAKAQTYHKKLEENNEIEALLTALRGGFVAPGAGGDPVRNPQTTSGTNLYALDPNKIPSREAYQAAETSFAELLANHREKHDGRWPDKLAFSLWSSETIRTLGLGEAQIMHALGVRPVWGRGGRVTGLEIIPESELGRPRIDTLIQATSVYRDQFDGIMKKLARVIAELSRQEAGDTNPIARNSRRLALSLREQGLPTAEASRYAHARIFSNPPGDYGSGVTDVAMDSTDWEDDGVLADTFIRSQSHMYTEDDWGTSVQSLGLLESQLQGVDAVLLSRSSNLHGLLSTDHPYEYLGGLSSAVKKVTGENPQLYVSDARSTTTTITGANTFLSNELRTRYQNPQWIEGMKTEGYAGTVQMLKVVNNLFGWQVMDRNMVRADQWQSMHETYVMDRRELGLNEWFAEHNATAQAQLIERMMEAVRKGYWDASAQTLREMTERWQTLVEELGADAGAEKTVEFIQQQAAGFGLSSAAANQIENPVKGQILEQVSAEPQQQPDSNWPLWLAWLFLLACFTTGMARVLARRPNFYKMQWN